MRDHLKKLTQILQQHQQSTLWVAFSGGLDSRVLLHSVLQVQPNFPDIKIKVAHVNHGLSSHADDWANQCQILCRQLGLDCRIKTLNLRAEQQGASLEELARNARYHWFAQLLEPNDILLTGHTLDDQAETLLLQLLRGSGVKGMAAMPDKKRLGPGWLLRPFLGIDRSSLHTIAIHHSLEWIEDESNVQTKFDRNYLRHQVFPQLIERWPATKKLLARAANHAAEADELLDEVAAQDLSLASNGSGQITIPILQQLSRGRQKNLLRFWLKQQGFSLPSQVKLEQILQEVVSSREDAKAVVHWPGVEIRRFRNCLYALSPQPKFSPAEVLSWSLKQPLLLPNNQGCLVACGAESLGASEVTVKFRRGGERFHPLGRKGSHPLKKLLQEWQVPPWRRNNLPLIFLEDLLLAIPGYGVHQAYPDFSVALLQT